MYISLLTNLPPSQGEVCADTGKDKEKQEDKDKRKCKQEEKYQGKQEDEDKKNQEDKDKSISLHTN